MPHVGHPWRKHFCDARFIVMEVDTSVMIILVMSWNTSTTAQVWLSWFCHKIVMDVHAWQKTWPTMTNMYHHGSVFFCSAYLYHHLFVELVHLYNLSSYWVCLGHKGLLVLDCRVVRERPPSSYTSHGLINLRSSTWGKIVCAWYMYTSSFMITTKKIHFRDDTYLSQ